MIYSIVAVVVVLVISYLYATRANEMEGWNILLSRQAGITAI
jgi:hypothetical protein